MPSTLVSLPQFPAHEDCTECGLCDDTPRPGMPTHCHIRGEQGGPALLVIGQNPDYLDASIHEAFAGGMGHSMKEGYLGPLLPRNPALSVYLTHAVRCPSAGKKPPASAEKCFKLHTLPDLREILHKHSKIGVVLLGATAVSAATRAGLLPKKTTLTKLMRSQPLAPEGWDEVPLLDGVMAIFATYAPGAVKRDTALAAAVGAHMNLVHQWLNDCLPEPLKCKRVPCRAPEPGDSRYVGLDIESFGAIHGFPTQTCFIAPLALKRDGVKPTDLVQTVALTLYRTEEVPCDAPAKRLCTPLSDSQKRQKQTRQSTMSTRSPASSTPSSTPPPSSPSPSSRTRMKRIPMETMVFRIHHRAEREQLFLWLSWTTHILGMNLLFDLTWSRTSSILLRRLLAGRQTLTDVSVLNVLDNEARPERGLDDIGQITGAGTLEKKLAGGFRFKSGDDPELLDYNGDDSYGSVVIADTLEERLTERTPPSDYSSSFYSDLMWATIHMQESGVPFSRRELRAVQRTARERVARCERASDAPLSGKGSGTATAALVRRAYDLVNVCTDESIEDHPCFERTDTGLLPESKLAVRLYVELLRHAPEARDVTRQLRLRQWFTTARDIQSRYTDKFLAQGVSTVQHFRDVALVFPAWHMTPSPFKDNQGAEGGTRNSRFAASNPPIQQVGEANVKHCIRSRHFGGSIVWFDLGQNELRTLAVESGDPFLVSAFRDGVDMHTALSVAVAGKDVLQNPWFKTGHTTKDPRQTYKKGNFLCTYGGGPKMFLQSCFKDGGPLLRFGTAKRIVDTIREQRAVAVSWQQNLVERVVETGWLELPFTRQCRHFSRAMNNQGWTPKPVDERSIMNYPTQAEASNVLCRIMCVWANLPKGVRMFINMHDGLGFDCPPGTGPATMEAVREQCRWVEREDYWSMIQNYYGTEVPMAYDLYEIPNP